MKIVDCLQGSSEWLAARAGLPTASNFHKILTPKTMKPSSQATAYLHRLLAEKMLGRPIVEPAVTSWMSRGTELEGEAVAYFEFLFDRTTTKIGFFTNDAGTVGSSPDRLDGPDDLLEIKCPAEQTHVGYLLGSGVDDDYRTQLQGQLWVGERARVRILSYYPGMPHALVVVDRDERFIKALAEHVGAFVSQLAEATETAMAKGWIVPPPAPCTTVREVTDAELEVRPAWARRPADADEELR